MESDSEFPADANGTGRGAEEPQLPAADEDEVAGDGRRHGPLGQFHQGFDRPV